MALVLELRLIGSTGYMPSFDHGGIAIVVCPDADPNAPLAVASPQHHHHGHSKHHHAICTYAAAAALGALGPDFTPLLQVLLFAGALLLGQALVLPVRHALRVRPPSRGPPLPG
jgi:Protein of unknown function (DUF2946)